MYNELLFLAHIVAVSGAVLWGLWFSYGALISTLGLQLIFANLFVTKQIMLFGIETTCSEVFIVSGMYGISLIRYYYNDARARRAIWEMFGFLLFFVCLTQFHCAYDGIDADMSLMIAQLCSTGLRMLLASFLAYLVSERVHLVLTRLLGGVASAVASVGAVIGGQLVDTVVFAFAGLYGVVDDVRQIILFTLLIKGVIILLLAPLVAGTKRFVIGGKNEF